MPLSPGTRLGPYEILAPLGAGGMGEVYKGRDTRLDRTVAIKVSAARFSERFEREAHAVAAFNHPHICTLYDVGPDYLVMELIEGAPLKGPLPLDQALKLAAQIADALDAAHCKGIVHRDLKPGNILLTKSGVKLLDFGLAKTSPAAKTTAEDETVTRALTQEGLIVGTLQYMAPEQLRGGHTDARSDIFSFGCVLYELLTGRRAFDGKDSASIIAAILKEEPPSISTLAPVTPPALNRLLQKCLAKDPDDRWQSARDLRDELLWIASASAEIAVPAVPSASLKRERFAWIALVILAAAAAFIFSRPHSPAAPQHVVRVPLALKVDSETLTLSPDGEKILFGETGEARIYDMTSAESRPLAGFTGLERFGFSFWSPDSRAVGFGGASSLRKIDLESGLVSAIRSENEVVTSAAWTPDGGVLFSRSGDGVSWLPAAGGEVKALTKLVSSDAWHLGIAPLPDGRRFLFFAGGKGGGPGETRIGSMDGKPPMVLMKTDSLVAYAEPGYLLYLKGDTLVAQPFDASRVAITGAAQPLINRVGRFRFNSAIPLFSVSQNGLLVYRPGTRFQQSQLTWLDRNGTPSGTVGEWADYSNPALSPDGARLAVCMRDPQIGTRDIWILDLARGGGNRFTFDPSDDTNPVWSPDGSQIAFTSARKGARDLYLKNVSGVGQEELLLASTVDKNAENWSPDGKFLSFNYQTAGGYNLWFLGMSAADRQPAIFHSTPFREVESSFSPDGKFLAYTSYESGGGEIFAQSLAPGGGRFKISTHGGVEPQWRPDGKELFYISGNMLTAVDIKVSGNSLVAGLPHALFKLSTPPNGRNRYVVARDGKRFLMIVPEQQRAPAPPIVVVNWPALLPKK